MRRRFWISTIPAPQSALTDPGLTAAYDYDLPNALIAQTPAMPRDSSRLLVLRAGRTEHAHFRDLPQYLRAGDLLVLNETRVLAARILAEDGIEMLLLRPSDRPHFDPAATRWHALGKPGRKLRPGCVVSFGDLGAARVLRLLDDGIREVELSLHVPLEAFLQRAGVLPLPPYIHNESAQAQERYQTIFAREPGSVAAPTASLHFTQGVFEGLRRRGVETVPIVLDVGIATFRPMRTEHIDRHRMHGEYFSIPAETAASIDDAKRQGRRIVAAGTTVVRALEGSAAKHGRLQPGSDETELFIKPGFRFRLVDALITNFHLPRSTLLVLVSAFAGRDRILRAYAEAVARGYRFFSFGDAMYIEP
jgi:S-adenosylmethionine:tRNA ribosyltransferase-isomerase